MAGETDLSKLLKTMQPRLHTGDYVFCTIPDLSALGMNDVIAVFKEVEGITVIIPQNTADLLGLEYDFVAAWITLTVHSSLHAVGLTAAFSVALAENGISCNVVAAYFHDHIFVAKHDADTAMKVLNRFSER